jgi:hypothetical protein
VKSDNSFYIGKNRNDAEFLFLRIVIEINATSSWKILQIMDFVIITLEFSCNVFLANEEEFVYPVHLKIYEIN